jgi:hypothetical protein
VACRNPELAKLRAHKREELLAATETSLHKIKARVDAGKLVGREQIGLRVGKVINQYKVAKHFELTLGDHALAFARKRQAIAAEAALDGVYIIRTSLSPTHGQPMSCSQVKRRAAPAAGIETAAFSSIANALLRTPRER